MRKPLSPALLEWFRAYMRENTYDKTQWKTNLSPNTITATLETGTASAGVIARLEQLRDGTLEAPETLAVRNLIATQHAARIIALAAEAFPPDRQRLILESLPPDVREAMAVRNGALKPLRPKQGKLPGATNM